jgi:hypothetical protein
MLENNFHLSLKSTREKLKSSGKEFAEFFKHGSLVVELYKPDKIDKQTPHTRDEVLYSRLRQRQIFLQGQVR